MGKSKKSKTSGDNVEGTKHTVSCGDNDKVIPGSQTTSGNDNETARPATSNSRKKKKTKKKPEMTPLTDSSSSKESGPGIASAPEPAVSASPGQSVEKSYQMELKWCQDHIAGLLESGKLSKEAQYKNTKVSRILHSSKASFVEKRRAMSSLGDYRTKMAHKDAQLKSNKKKSKIEAVEVSNIPSSFFKKAHSLETAQSLQSSELSSTPSGGWMFELPS